MQAKRNTTIISWALGILTIIVLLLNLPEQPDPANIGLWLLFTLLIALSLNLGVLLTSGEISSAHMFGIMAFLSLGHDGRAEEALWIVATGALLGGLVQVARAEEWLPRRRVTVRSLGSVLETMAQLTLSQLVGEALYLQSGGRLPLGVITQADIFPLIIFAVGYVLFYLLFFVLRVRMEGHSISDVLASDWVTLGGAVLLPQLKAKLSADRLQAVACALTALVLVGFALSRSMAPAIAAALGLVVRARLSRSYASVRGSGSS